ncbi:MAG: acyl carrier protein [Gammaproteobacteria bacterium]|jgi:acyl carrier protein
MNVEQVYPQVKNIVADVLAIDEEEVGLKDSLVKKLGAESIDFLDLIFRLEKEFNIKIPRGQIEKEARGTLSEAEFESNGVLTEAGISALKKYMPEVAESEFKSGMLTAEIPTLFTVETICKLITKAQEQQDTK